jgi:hypothetical protein
MLGLRLWALSSQFFNFFLLAARGAVGPGGWSHVRGRFLYLFITVVFRCPGGVVIPLRLSSTLWSLLTALALRRHVLKLFA